MDLILCAAILAGHAVSFGLGCWFCWSKRSV